MFLVDTNVLIEAKNRYYGFDFVPGFWSWLDAAHDSGLVCSIDAVKAELIAGDDDLADWARDRPMFFRSIDLGTTRHFTNLTSWASAQSFTPAALSAFTGTDADYLRVAYAREHNHVVVTLEVSQPQSKRRVLIPDACIGIGVEYTSTFTMLRATGAVFELPHP